jgi:NADPH2:quinone reductase
MTGMKVVVSELAEDPIDAIDRAMRLVPMDVPAPGPGEVVIAIASASVGWVDLIMSSGQYQHMAKPPYTPGLEYAGTVAAIGAEVVGRTLGERVLVDGFLAGPRSLGAYQGSGGFATHALAPAAAVRPIPGALSFDQACNLLGNYETAYHCLIARGQIQAGETVLIHGASGSTGLAMVHVAKLRGATVIATGRADDKLAVVRAQGADHVLNVRGPDGGLRSFKDEVKALTGGRGVDLVADGVGGDISLESLRCVRFGARYLIVGWASTPAVAPGRGQRGVQAANTLPTNLIMMKGLDVLGCPAAITVQHDPSKRVARLAEVWRWAETGMIAPYVSHVFALADFKDALRAKWRGEVIGGCVLHP